MAKHVVGRVEEVPPGGRKIVASKGARSASSTSRGNFYALRNSCPHQAARVCLGKIVGTALPSDVYEFGYGREGQILRCPWRDWEYDITTGESVFDPTIRVKTYEVGDRERRRRRDRRLTVGRQPRAGACGQHRARAR